MARHLLQTTEVYRVDSEAEAKALIEEAKDEDLGDLIKYTSTYKNQKQKGEIIQEWYRVSLTKNFSDEKEPTESITINYEN